LLLQDDSIAFEEIFHRYWAPLLDTAYRRTKNLDQSKDIVQDVLTDLWQRRGKVNIENLGAYLNTAVRFQFFKLVSRKKSAPLIFELLDTITSLEYSAENNIQEKELQELLGEWLNTLPKKRKEIFILHYREDMTTKEIADHLNISQKTVQNQLGRATNDLHEKMVLSSVLFFAMSLLAK